MSRLSAMINEESICKVCMVVELVGVLFAFDMKLLGLLPFPQLLTGTVSSLEDHGYLVDIGVVGTRAFLSLQKNKGEG